MPNLCHLGIYGVVTLLSFLPQYGVFQLGFPKWLPFTIVSLPVDLSSVRQNQPEPVFNLLVFFHHDRIFCSVFIKSLYLYIRAVSSTMIGPIRALLSLPVFPNVALHQPINELDFATSVGRFPRFSFLITPHFTAVRATSPAGSSPKLFSSTMN